MAGKIEHMARIYTTARHLGKDYATAHPLPDGGTVGPAHLEALTLAGSVAADGHMQAEQSRIARGREAFLEAFTEGAMEIWKPRPASRERQPGDTEIASVQLFGRWRVQVYRLARTAQDQENTLTGIPADNWQALEKEAAALMLAAFGTIETASNGLVCSPDLAGRARWQNWIAKHCAPAEGK